MCCVGVCVFADSVGSVQWIMHKFPNSAHHTSRSMDLHYSCYGEEYLISPELEQVVENKASHTHNPHQKTSQYPTFMDQCVCVCVCVCVHVWCVCMLCVWCVCGMCVVCVHVWCVCALCVCVCGVCVCGVCVCMCGVCGALCVWCVCVCVCTYNYGVLTISTYSIQRRQSGNLCT